jgi:hypothetical protein
MELQIYAHWLYADLCVLPVHSLCKAGGVFDTQVSTWTRTPPAGPVGPVCSLRGKKTRHPSGRYLPEGKQKAKLRGVVEGSRSFLSFSRPLPNRRRRALTAGVLAGQRRTGTHRAGAQPRLPPERLRSPRRGGIAPTPALALHCTGLARGDLPLPRPGYRSVLCWWVPQACPPVSGASSLLRQRGIELNPNLRCAAGAAAARLTHSTHLYSSIRLVVSIQRTGSI